MVIAAVPNFVPSCAEVAVTVAVVAVLTVGAMYSPEAEMVPGPAVHTTAELKLPVPVTTEVHWLSWLDRIVGKAQVTVTELIVPEGWTKMLADPDFVESWTEVAVTVTCALVATTGAVNTPLLSTEPELAVQFTAELKLLVPVTVAAH
jgi:hypothetical protein